LPVEISGPREGGRTDLHNKKLCDLHSLCISIRTVKSRKLVNQWGRRDAYKVSWEKILKERAHLEDLGVDGRLISK
jgi:hypothetical protein